MAMRRPGMVAFGSANQFGYSSGFGYGGSAPAVYGGYMSPRETAVMATAERNNMAATASPVLPPVLKEVTRVRAMFPETWIWADLKTWYITREDFYSKLQIFWSLLGLGFLILIKCTSKL